MGKSQIGQKMAVKGGVKGFQDIYLWKSQMEPMWNNWGFIGACKGLALVVTPKLLLTSDYFQIHSLDPRLNPRLFASDEE